jgi:Domain of unknown function (DUF4157)
MLYSPTSDRKTKANASAKTAEQEQSPQLSGWRGRSSSFQQRENLAGLQKTYGNQAVLRMKGQSSGQTPVTSSPLNQGGILQRKCACGNTAGSSGTCAECQKKGEIALPGTIQTKLTISQPGDKYEQEADRIADQVSATPTHFAVIDASPRIQRFTAQTTRWEDMAAPASVDRVLSSPGSPLEPSLQQDMEQRFGHDFSRVRVHTDAEAGRSAREVNANAYTVGQNIVFGASRYAPGSVSGRRLLAHELTHVIQQGNAPPIEGGSDQAYTGGPGVVNSSERDGATNCPECRRNSLLPSLPNARAERGAEPIQSVYSISPTRLSGEAQVQRQLDPNKLTCAALCAICAGTLIAPELILPEIACAMCFRLCVAGQG